MTWPEVEAVIAQGAVAILPTGSTEQHGPMGLCGTDTLCAAHVARAVSQPGVVVAPVLAYTPAPFNTAFPGTVSVSVPVFEALLTEVCTGLLAQGFLGIFVLNGHGANLAPARKVAARMAPGAVHVQSWWDPAPVADLRRALYGDWEGMHATPSEVAITQALFGAKPAGAAAMPPVPLTAEYIKAHAGDRHGPPEAHRAQFPDGRVGSHSALATPQEGARILEVASKAATRDVLTFLNARRAAAG
ncbi:MAG: creatininase family protein [Pseudomonadota bacterium]